MHHIRLGGVYLMLVVVPAIFAPVGSVETFGRAAGSNVDGPLAGASSNDRRQSTSISNARSRSNADNRFQSGSSRTPTYPINRPQPSRNPSESRRQFGAELTSDPTTQLVRGPSVAQRQRFRHSNTNYGPSRSAIDQLNNSRRRQNSSILSTPKPRVQAQTPDDNQQLLCIIKLYMDALVDYSVRRNEKVDLNDRIAFFIPLIIIYWRHRHPGEPFPHTEIDTLLSEIGEEAELHRRILQDVMKKAESQCARASNARSLILPRQRDERRAAEALRILRDWLDDSEQFEARESSPTTPATRQSVGREIRLWFESLVNLNRRNQGNSNDRLRLSNTETESTTSATTQATGGSSFIATPTSNTFSQLVSVITTRPTVTLNEATLRGSESEPTTIRTINISTEPSYNDKQPTTISGLVNSEHPPGTTSSPLPQVEPSPATNDSSFNISLINELSHLGTVLSRRDEPSRTSLARLTQYGEFFEMVSSIIEEINNIHNAAAGSETRDKVDQITSLEPW